MTEQLLIDAAKKGCPKALDQLYLNHHSRIFNLALRYVCSREDAEDVVQETFLKAFGRIRSYEAEYGAGFAAWINRICIHCAIDFLRARKRQRRASTSLDALPQDPPSPLPNPEQISIEQGVSRLVQNAVTDLPARQQIIFTMRYREYMKIRQIAVRLECSEGNIRSHLFRTTARLRRAFRASA
jgi:RNA polymerase sigma-70 factor (ECF subfamily)